MTAELRRQKKRVGILTVDPSSPISRGALLGDRIRMRSHFLDSGVFIRSLATRGSHGGLSSCMAEAIHLLDAMGKEFIFVETIGIGQDQIEISHIAHTVVVVVTPDTGDEIQAMKAGILEMADILVVNKADLARTEELFLQLSYLFGDASVPIFKTSASKNEGIAALVDGIKSHRVGLLASGDHKSRALNVSRDQLLALVRDKLIARAMKKIDERAIERLVQQISERQLDPYTAAEQILKMTGR
jgi:LAO/AO transport system kinase